VSELVTSTGTGSLVMKNGTVTIHYRLHAHIGGRAVMIELLDRPYGLASDEDVRVVLEGGGELSCHVLDDTSMCAVVGEGLSERDR
jgi:hypothetical protein